MRLNCYNLVKILLFFHRRGDKEGHNIFLVFHYSSDCTKNEQGSAKLSLELSSFTLSNGKSIHLSKDERR